MNPPDVLIALGSNLGDRAGWMQRALDALRTHVTLTAVSPILETAPMYLEDQPTFYNAAARGTTELGPRALLNVLKQIEADLGRQRRERNGPREIDLDVVAYGALSYRGTFAEGALEIPHPRAWERAFVIQPLMKIAPDVLLPGYGTVAELAAKDELRTQRVQWTSDAVLQL